MPIDKVYAVEEIQTIVAPIMERYGVSRAYLFGSYARGDAAGASDVDFRIDGGEIKSMFGLGALYHDLTEALHKSVDIVTTDALLHPANANRTIRFRDHIKEDERLIYEKQKY